jgi:hypothetical protein
MDEKPMVPEDVIEGIEDIEESWTVDGEGLDEALNL